MIKAAELFRKRQGMSDAAFHDYWLNGHDKVVLALDGVVRYVQNHPIRPGTARTPRLFDGVVEIWFESLEVMRRNGETPYWPQVVADEARFIDRSTLRLVLGDEVVLHEGVPKPDALKTITVLHRHAGLSPADFQDRYRTGQARLIADVPGLVRHAVTFGRLAGYKAGKAIACDGLAMSWFNDDDALDEAWRSTAYARAQADRARFASVEGGLSTVVREHVMKAG